MEKVILFAVLLFGAAYSLEFEHCEESEGVVPVDFYIYRCFEMPCTFQKDNKTTGNIKFMASEEINQIDVEVFVENESFEASYQGEGVHKCTGYPEGECKYEAGTNVNFFFLFPIIMGGSSEEDVHSFKMILKNENGTPLTCAKFNARIRDTVPTEQPVTESTK